MIGELTWSLFWVYQLTWPVRGKKRRDTVLICLSQDDVEEGKIAMNKGKSLRNHKAIPEKNRR